MGPYRKSRLSPRLRRHARLVAGGLSLPFVLLPSQAAPARSLQISCAPVVAAELLASSTGLGFMMVNASRNLQPEFIMLSMAMIGILGALMTQGLERLQHRLISWQEPPRE